MTESTKNGLKAGLKHTVAKTMMNPKMLAASGALLIHAAPALAVIGAVGAAGYGISKLIRKNSEQAKETV